MNILVYFENIINPITGGTERAAYNLSSALQSIGHKVITLAKRKGQKNIVFPVFYLPNESDLLNMENIKFIEALCIEKSIDIIINEGGNTSDVQLFNNNILNIKAKIITCLHFSPYQGYDKYYYSDILIKSLKDWGRFFKMPYNKHNALQLFKHNYKIALEYTNAFVVLNDSFKDDIIKITNSPINYSRIVTIPNINTIYPSNKNLSEKDNLILYVGRLQYNTKRVDRLLKSWKLIEHKLPDWTLNILGDGPDRQWYEDFTKKLKLNRVSFEGLVNPVEYYKKAKIVCLVSTHESFGMTLVEGMAYGCVPIVYHSYPTASEILDMGQCGILVQPFDIADYATKLYDLINDVDRYDYLSDQATKKSLEYTSSRIIEKWDRLFNELYPDGH